MWKRGIHRYITISLLISISTTLSAQMVHDRGWKELVYKSSEEWYNSDEAIVVAENVLLYQRDIGGWPKNILMHHELSIKEKKNLKKLKHSSKGATIDNGATKTELDFLSRIYAANGDKRYSIAFLNGIDYLLDAQYENGGWPQFYPLDPGAYSTHITYNDDAMVNVMNIMKDIADKSDRFSINLDDVRVLRAKKAFEKGIQCILKTQYVQEGILTVWCAQHDEITFQPAQARSYELASLSGSESVEILVLLMKIEDPSKEIITAIISALTWFEKSKIMGIRMERFKNPQGKTDRRIVEDPDAPPLWARFYDLSDNRPIFCDRDGIKKYSLAEIGHERRNNYGWYTRDPSKIFEEYNIWKLKLKVEEEDVILKK